MFRLFSTLLLVVHPLVADVDLSSIVDSFGVDSKRCAIEIVRLDEGLVWTSGGERLDVAYPPASTAKIPHTLIALEEQMVSGPDAFFEWDGVERAMEIWNCDQTLRSAFHRSAVWVYRRIIAELGAAVVSGYLDRFEYGNRSIGAPSDLLTYWLNGPLAISARQQIDFLRRLVSNDLSLQSQTYQVARRVFLEKSEEGIDLYGKSGLSRGVGWYVGWVETPDGLYLFALNMDLSDSVDPFLRREIVFAALEAVGVSW